MLSHFLELLGVGVLGTGTFKRYKTRPSAKVVEVARLTTAALLRDLRNGRRRPPQMVWRELHPHIRPLVAPDAPFAGFSADEANIVMTRFEVANARFARDYGIDPGGIVFRDPIVDVGACSNVASWHDFDESERVAVRECVRQIVGIDPQPPTGRRGASICPRNAPPRPGSARWRVSMLCKPQLLHYWNTRLTAMISEGLRRALCNAILPVR